MLPGPLPEPHGGVEAHVSSEKHIDPLPRLGAYGLHLPDLRPAGSALVSAPAEWPTWRIDVRVADEAAVRASTPDLEVVDAARARLRLAGGGWMEADRAAGRSTLHLSHRPDPIALVHPYFSLSAAVAAFWHGDLSLHAAAAVIDGGAWALLGDKGAGKSSTLAALAAAGHAVLADDVLVVRGGEALAGPRTIDLRDDAGARTPDAAPLGRVGARERWRVTVGETAVSVPFRGFFVLGWGESAEVRPLEPEKRLIALLANMSLRLPPLAPQELRRAAALPAFELRRPRRPELLPETVDEIRRVARLS